MNYLQKYSKYTKKYLELKFQIGRGTYLSQINQLNGKEHNIKTTNNIQNGGNIYEIERIKDKLDMRNKFRINKIF